MGVMRVVRARHRSLQLPPARLTSPNCIFLPEPESDLPSPQKKRHDPGVWEARRALGPRSPGSGQPPHRSFSLGGALVARFSKPVRVHIWLGALQRRTCVKRVRTHHYFGESTRSVETLSLGCWAILTVRVVWLSCASLDEREEQGPTPLGTGPCSRGTDRQGEPTPPTRGSGKSEDPHSGLQKYEGSLSLKRQSDG